MTPTAPAQPAVQHLDPRTLLVDLNIREHLDLDPDFLASVADLGVLVPVVAVETADGRVRVRLGNRRTLAAVEGGLATVPVVVAGPEDDDHVTRIVAQWAENEHRAALTSHDKVRAFEQLAAFGLSSDDIAAKTRTPRARVDAALTVAASSTARAAVADHPALDIEQAAVLAEFADDAAARDTLLAAARDGQFTHTAQRLRDDRKSAEERDALTTVLTAEGVRVVERPAYEDKDVVRVGGLLHDGEQVTPDNHATCPGHAAYLSPAWEYPDGETGTAPALTYRPEYVCTDWKANGHTTARSGAPAPTTEQAKAERRRVVENNKAWRSATEVRRQWLRQLLQRKTAPKGTVTFVLSCLAAGDHELRRSMERDHLTTRDLLGDGTTPTPPAAFATALERAGDQRAQVYLLALVLGAYEDAAGSHTWRHPVPAMRRYLTALETWGYELADVEKLVTASPGSAHDEDEQPGDAD